MKNIFKILLLILLAPIFIKSMEPIHLQSDQEMKELDESIDQDKKALVNIGKIHVSNPILHSIINEHLIADLTPIVLDYTGKYEHHSREEYQPVDMFELDNGYLIINSHYMCRNKSHTSGHSEREVTVWKPNDKFGYNYVATLISKGRQAYARKLNNTFFTLDNDEPYLNIYYIDKDGNPAIWQQLECFENSNLDEIQNNYFYLYERFNFYDPIIKIKIYKKDETNKFHYVNTFTINTQSFRTLIQLQNNCVAIVANHNQIFNKSDRKEKVTIIDTTSNKIVQILEDNSKSAYSIDIKGLIKLKSESLVYFLNITEGDYDRRKGDYNIKIWSLNKDGSYKLQELKGHTYHIRKVIELENGSLVSYSADKTIKIWDAKKNGQYECIQTIHENCDNDYNHVYIEQFNGYIISFSDSIKIWKQNKDGLYTLIQTVTDHNKYIRNLTKLKNGNLISCSKGDESVKIWKWFNKK